MLKLSLNAQILLGALAGVPSGLVFNAQGVESDFAKTGVYVCSLVGGVFVDLLKMVLIPLVFTSIAVGIANLPAHDAMHRVWTVTLANFLATTALAVLLGLFAANLFQPGAGLNPSLFREAMSGFDANRLNLQEFFVKFLHSLFLNPLAAMAQGEVVSTVICALFLGVGLVASGEKSRRAFDLLSELLDIVMLIVGWLLSIAPLGLMALLAELTATQTPELFSSLGKFVAAVLGSTLLHGFVVLPGVLFLMTGIGPHRFYPHVKEALLTAFATSSSSATAPVTMGRVELSLGQQLIVFFAAILASIGAPGIPSAGMVTRVMVLQSVGLPAPKPSPSSCPSIACWTPSGRW